MARPRRQHLTPTQHRALALLSAGSTAAAAARSVGVHSNTIANWQRSAPFCDALAAIRREQALAWQEQARSLARRPLSPVQPATLPPTPVAIPILTPASPRTVTPRPAVAPPPRMPTALPPRADRPGRNQPCPCGSGR